MGISLRERKKVKARQTIIEEATRLFLEKGFDQTTVDEIAEAAEVSRSTFFRYFPAKETVVFPYQEERLAMLHSMIMGYESEQASFDAVRLGLVDMADYFTSIKEEQSIQREIIYTSPYLMARQLEFDKRWEIMIAGRLAAGRPSNPETLALARQVAGAIFGMIQATLREWFDSECEPDLAQMGRKGLEILEHGLKTTQFCSKKENS